MMFRLRNCCFKISSIGITIIGTKFGLNYTQRHRLRPTYGSNNSLFLRNAYLIDTKAFSKDWFTPFVSIRPSFRKSDPNGYPEGPQDIIGSGFIVDKKGFVLTGHSVVGKYGQVLVRLGDGREVIGKVIVIDMLDEIYMGLIKLEGDDQDWPVVRLGNPRTLDVDDRVLAVGNPKFGIYNDITDGYICSLNRLGSVIPELANNGIMSQLEFIQHTAAIPSTKFGSALINTDGDVIGLNVIQYSLRDNVCIPSDSVLMNFMTEVIEKYYETNAEHSFEMIIYWLDSEMRQQLLNRYKSVSLSHFPDGEGIIIWQISEDNEDNWNGIKQYDVITHINGKSVSKVDDLYWAVEAMRSGLAVNLRVNNGSNELQQRFARKPKDWDNYVQRLDQKFEFFV